MDELAQDVADRLHRAVDRLDPAGDLAARIRARVERRQRRRRLLYGGLPAAVLVVGAVALVAAEVPGGPAPRSTASTAPSFRTPSGSVPQGPSSAGGPVSGSRSAAAPVAPAFGPAAGNPAAGDGVVGWIPVDLAGGRVSVPPGSVVAAAGCPDPNAPATVFLRGPHAPPNLFFCPAEPVGLTTITLSQLAPGTSTAGMTATMLNGVPVYRSDGGPGATSTVLVPALGIEIDGSGSRAPAILDTLSRSARSVALAGGRPPRVPRTWHRVTFGGLRFAVPAGWSVHRVATWGPPCGSAPAFEQPGLAGGPSSVALDAGRLEPAADCPAIVAARLPARPASDGVVVDPGPVGPLTPGAAYGPCRSIKRLRVCVDQDYPYSQLVLRVGLPSGRTVAVAIGLGGVGTTARTVLASLQPA